MKLSLIGTHQETSEVTTFRFKPDQALSWQAGQYLHYTFPHEHTDSRGTERWFTISAAPSEKEVRISTRFASEHGSSFKTALKALPEGAELSAEGPEGDFVITDPARNYLFIAGGIGITPFRSILREASNAGQELTVTLLYANRTNEVPFREELDQLSQRNRHLTIHYIIEPQRIDEALLKFTLAGIQNPYVYVSGPEPMVKAMETTLSGLGVTKENLKNDDFPGYTGI